jgi:hypothetical protein
MSRELQQRLRHIAELQAMQQQDAEMYGHPFGGARKPRAKPRKATKKGGANVVYHHSPQFLAHHPHPHEMQWMEQRPSHYVHHGGVKSGGKLVYEMRNGKLVAYHRPDHYQHTQHHGERAPVHHTQHFLMTHPNYKPKRAGGAIYGGKGNDYTAFVKANYDNARNAVLSMHPGIHGRDLNTAVLREIGQMWRQ